MKLADALAAAIKREKERAKDRADREQAIRAANERAAAMRSGTKPVLRPRVAQTARPLPAALARESERMQRDLVRFAAGVVEINKRDEAKRMRELRKLRAAARKARTRPFRSAPPLPSRSRAPSVVGVSG